MQDREIEQRISSAIHDELSAVSEYALLARDLPDDELRLITLSIMGDEYGHARTWFTLKAMMQLMWDNAQPYSQSESGR
ncbi:MAG: hypothetical protein IMX01_00805 [Limnochordaceae bacterium]|nr:hypothetical protein [Limnochordaceae bacterium]